MKRELVRPLSKEAMAVLDGVPRILNSPFVFTATGKTALTGLSTRKKDFMNAAGPFGENWTLHDLRRTARSLLARAGISSDHAEKCLGHVVGGVEGTYDRHSYVAEMRHAYELLAALVNTIVDPPTGNIVQLRG